MAQAIEGVARKLGNTKAVCRKCYVHPAVLETYEDGDLVRLLPAPNGNGKQPAYALSKMERAVAALLERAARRTADRKSA